MHYDFVAIDFETATPEMNSACAVGIVCVDNFEIVQKDYFLIQPPGNEYSPYNTEIHGLTSEDTKNAPQFDSIWNQIAYLFDGSAIIVAHNARFDMSVLKACFDTYSIVPPDFTYIDSIAITNRQIRDKNISGSLEARAQYFNVPLEEHHNALCDAVVCAKICIAAVRMTNRHSLHTYCFTYRTRTMHQFSELKPMLRFNRPHYMDYNEKDIKAADCAVNESNPLYGKNVVFTGEFSTMTRNAAAQKVIDAGGFVKSGVNKKTDYLFIGVQDSNVVGEAGHSTKERRANELIASGADIKIFNEKDFLNMLYNKGQ